MKIESFPFTAIGGREDNQDAYGQKIEGDSALFVVADGLGGHRLGSLASGCVVSSLTESWKAEGEYDAESMTAMIGAANDAVLKMQEEQTAALEAAEQQTEDGPPEDASAIDPADTATTIENTGTLAELNADAAAAAENTGDNSGLYTFSYYNII